MPCVSSRAGDRFVQLPAPGTGGGVVVTRVVLGGATVATVGPPQAAKARTTDAIATIMSLGDVPCRSILSTIG